jgi:antitoxin component YwqK of YwqJK toxin-antitoxin module
MFKWLWICFVFASCSFNRVDKHHFRQGRWKEYYDDEKTQVMWKGRYKNHHQVGHWKYYSTNGVIYLEERYTKQNLIQTVYYDSKGRKHLSGDAVYYETLDTAYYRWEGDWLKYDTTGQVVEVSYYKFGKFAWNKPPGATRK